MKDLKISYAKQDGERTNVEYSTIMDFMDEIEEDINNPNDLLGISYIKAIRQINPNIKAETIKRTNN